MKRVDLFFAALLVPLDYLTLLGAAAAAYGLRFSPFFKNLRAVVFNLNFDDYLRTAAFAALVWLLIFALSGLYAFRPHRLAVEFTRIILACSTGIAAVLAIAFFSRELFESRFILLAVWLLAIIFVTLERLLIRGLQRSLRQYGIGLKYVVIIGKTEAGNTLHDYFEKNPRHGFAMAGHFAHFNEDVANSILNLKKKNVADLIVFANPNADMKEVKAAKNFTDIEHLSFFYSAEIFPAAGVQPIIHTLAGQPVIEVPKTPLDGWGAIYKRLFDIVGSLVLIVLSLPIQILAALALFIEQPGNVFFFHERVGQGGQKYRHLKFRSMVRDAHKYRFDPEFLRQYGNERQTGPLFKLAHDPRVTKVGAIIRKLSIDEIPEFYMVLVGRMSLVGPRPHLPGEVANYLPEQRRVLTIKPGITGMAQVSGRADLTFDEEVRLDMFYIENWNPWLDLVILLKTPLVVLFKKGAY
jgi:exopolysaccharide biosynthesis polyprenyl glycosylphosphotransferase